MINPTVSVIVPNYNYKQFLASRIDTILNQTYRDFELILLDDCSTDNSREILESYRDNPHVSHIVFNEKNTGSPFRQWMKGIELARGKYVWIAEADDMSAPEFLETSITELNANPNAVATVTGSTHIDTDGKILPGYRNYWERRGMDKYRQPKSRSFNGRFYAIHKLFWACCIQKPPQPFSTVKTP